MSNRITIPDFTLYIRLEWGKIFPEHFSSSSVLVEEIQNRNFIKKIENPVPGNITEYEFVDEKDLIDFIEKFNNCVKPL